ncbi:hypothetical protein GCM10007853_00820 [Algimonas ampicilliniresistens]|uniref:Uncharacterized protein n=1 Tax=Algimonas ampicilliniresistens TaxID=1298735 RepID=A0ABQ5V5U0_9PROT|nr:hypothetical protein GCM10007853_00820 [Algimonas ampicilliniresistens]
MASIIYVIPGAILIGCMFMICLSFLPSKESVQKLERIRREITRREALTAKRSNTSKH